MARRPGESGNIEQLAFDNGRRVLTAFGPFCRRALAEPSQAKACEKIAHGLKGRLKQGLWRSSLSLPYYSVQAPMLVYQSISDDDEGAISIGLAALSYTIGVNLLDDVLDGDQSRFGPDVSESSGVLLGATAIAGLAPKAILEAPATVAQRLQALDLLTRGSLVTAGGQSLEMRSRRSMSPARALEVAEQKTGRGVEAMCGVAAILAGASDVAARKIWMPIGFHLACARQLASDIEDFADPEGGRDLPAGLVTYPIALLIAADQSATGETEALLAKGRKSVAARRNVIRQASEGAVFATAWAEVERHREAARRALDRARGSGLPRAALQGLVKATPRA